ncbi:hypothetical protein V7S43_017353 [Phytophthora oleae]|uniref:BZIP domain-containing protein n=1 Tax=Phytophthora oleae TaxID=2107226 RepID=A0ABD3ETG9_9STRA
MVRDSSFLDHSSLDAGDDDAEDIQKKPAKKENRPAASKASSYKRQQRYREKQRLLTNRLESSVKQLRMEVDQQLMAYRDAQFARPHKRTFDVNLSTTKVVAVMRECMQVFASGVQTEQATFLESAMRSDVQYGDLVGRDSILQHWMCFMRCFNDALPMEEQCEFSVKLQEQDVAVGLVRTMLTVRLTHQNLSAIFPYAFTDTHLRHKLLQESLLRLPLTVLFEFDERGKVSCYDPSIDFVNGLYAVLRSYEDVANVLSSGNIDPSGKFRGYVPPVVTSRVETSPGCGHASHNHNQLESSSSSANIDKLSVVFLLSTSEGTRCSDTGKQAAL